MILKKKIEQPRARQPITAPVSRPRPTYYASDKPANQDSVQTRRRTEKKDSVVKGLRSIPTALAILTILISLIFNTTLSTSPGLVFSGAAPAYRAISDYKTGVKKILDSSILNKNKLTINTANLQAEILKNYPELDAVNVSIPVVGRRPTVTLHAIQPALVITTKTNAYVLGANGKAILEAGKMVSSSVEKLIAVQDQSGLVLKVGSQALTSATVDFITNAKTQLEANQLKVSGMVLPNGGNEVDIRMSGLGYYIKTDSSGDARIQIGDFIAARGSGVVPAEYMDLRVEGKVFYK